MSMIGYRSVVCGDSFVRVIDAVTCTGQSELITKDIVINNLAVVKFKWVAKTADDKLQIDFFFSSSKHELAKNCIIKITVASDILNYFEQDIYTSEKWSEWQLIGSKIPVTGNGIYITLCEYYVRAFEVKQDKLSSWLHTDTDFTDFHLATTEGAVAVHKSCLAATSEVFKNMLTGEWKETAEGKINIKGVSLQTLQHLKDYMYLGTLPDDENGLRPLLLLARCYLIRELQKLCIRKLAESVVERDIYSLIEFACENNIPELAFTMLQITEDSLIRKASNINNDINNNKEPAKKEE